VICVAGEGEHFAEDELLHVAALLGDAAATARNESVAVLDQAVNR
jgi:hypothetical protein